MDESVANNLLELLSRAENHCSGADHLVSITMPVVKDAKLLMKGFDNLYKALTLSISIILKIDEMYKRVKITEDPKENLRIFLEHCAGRYGITVNEAALIQEIVFFGKKHRESAFEFSRDGKRVIMDDESGTMEIDVEKFKKYLGTTRIVLGKAKNELKDILERYK